MSLPETRLPSSMQGVDVVVAGPGRAREHLAAGTLRLDACRAVVLDEADLLLSEHPGLPQLLITAAQSAKHAAVLRSGCRQAMLFPPSAVRGHATVLT